ncbi:Yip1 family protein [uncultured Xylophilus sp.]|uniref:Yip1 family protein n=1 Tax=uncultured Xylophilus sp. TaxID=296832 RepID=UPI0025ED3A7B|nr:Yip1 family protein [uncultured Xylophilus sp.]
MSVLSRLQKLLLQPRAEWRRIDEDPSTAGRVVLTSLLPLAAIPALCSFVGLSLVGVGAGGALVRLPVAAGLLQALAMYLVAVLGIVLVAVVVKLVAPTFGARPEWPRAFKLAVYGSSAALLGGVFLAVPALSLMALVAALYSVYLVFTGLPAVMRTSQHKVVPFTAVIVLAGAVVGLLASAATSHFLARGLGDAAVVLQTPGGKLRLDAAGLEAASQKMADAAQRLEAASEKQSQAAAPVVGTGPVLGGDPDAGAVPAPALKAALPETLGAFTRTAVEMQGGKVTGMATSNARAEYSNGEQRLRVEMIDLGSMSKLMAEAGAVVQGERENSASAERTWQEGGRTLHENYRKDGSMAQYTTTLRNGVVVELTGSRMNLDEVKAASSLLDLKTLESLRRQPAS